jgi:cytochrome c553
MAEAVPPGASSCLGCHAPARVDAVIPSLRGRDSAAVAAALRAWREGAEPGS